MSTASSTPYLPRIGLLGAKTTTGCWVLEGALERGHELRILTSHLPSEAYASKVTLVPGTPKSAMDTFLYDNDNSLLVDVVIAVAMPGRMRSMAEAISKTLQGRTVKPRIVWMTGLVESREEGEVPPALLYDDEDHEDPPCFELASSWRGFHNNNIFCWFPYWTTHQNSRITDMIESESLIQEAATAQCVIVRPTELPSCPALPSTEAWRLAEAHTERFYQFVRFPDEAAPPESNTTTIPRRAVATALLDLAFDENRDGTIVELYKRDKSQAPIVSEQVDL